jgi:SAM-dependent methyltransferase
MNQHSVLDQETPNGPSGCLPKTQTFNHICPSCAGQEWNKKFVVDNHTYHKCASCGVLTTAPFPREADLESFYTSKNAGGDFYSLDMTRWLGLRERIFASYLKILAKRTDFTIRGARVLDVGCFNGASLNVLTRQGALAHGMERQGESAGHLHNSYPGRIFHQDACKFDDSLKARFDLVTMTDVVEHVLDPSTLMKNVSCWLREEGLVFLTTPNIRSLTARLMGGNWPSLLPVHHVYLFDRMNLMRILEREGLELVNHGILAKHLSLGYFAFVISRFKGQFSLIEKMMPPFLSNVYLPFFGGEMYIIARKRSGGGNDGAL